MMRHLTIAENLEDKRRLISEALGVPAFITAGGIYTGTHFRFPGSSEYVRVRAPQIFFSRLTVGSCVRRVDHTNGSDFFFDLFESRHLQIVVPLLASAKEWATPTKEETVAAFRSVGLKLGLNMFSSLDLRTDEDEAAVPAEFQPFIEDYKGWRHRARSLRRVRFLGSEFIANPQQSRPDWHLAEIEGANFTPIQAPGQYSGEPLFVAYDINRMVRVDCAPGPCVVCRGAKNERVHIAPLSNGPSPYPYGHICRGCTAETFASWQRLLET